jgi:hypothetical protein
MLITIATITGAGISAGLAMKILALLSLFVVGVLTFPTDQTNQANVSRGSGKLYFAPATVAGADPGTITEIGPTSGGIEWDGKRTLSKIECDQLLNPIGGFPSGEAWQIKASFLNDFWANHYNLWSTLGAEQSPISPANVLTGGTQASPAGSLTFGESVARRYMQLIWRGPGPGEQVIRTIQLWKCVPQGPGSVKFTKNKERIYTITWDVYTDPAAGAVSRGYVGIGIDA